MTPTLVPALALALPPPPLHSHPHPHPHPHPHRRVSFLKYDSEAARGRKGSPPPRLLRGFGGDEDLPSLSRFVTASLAATEGFMTTEFPKIAVTSSPEPGAEP